MATNTSILGLTKPTYAEDQDITVLNANSDLIDAEAGRLRANFAGTYSTSSAYAVGSYCIYQGDLYRCTTAISSSGEAWNASHWSQVSAGDELTTLNDRIGNKASKEWTLVASATAQTWVNFPSTFNEILIIWGVDGNLTTEIIPAHLMTLATTDLLYYGIFGITSATAVSQTGAMLVQRSNRRAHIEWVPGATTNGVMHVYYR